MTASSIFSDEEIRSMIIVSGVSNISDSFKAAVGLGFETKYRVAVVAITEAAATETATVAPAAAATTATTSAAAAVTAASRTATKNKVEDKVYELRLSL